MLQEHEDKKAEIGRASVLKNVFDHLNVKGLSNASLVSKEWCELSVESRFSRLKLETYNNHNNYRSSMAGDNIEVPQKVGEFIEFTRKYGHLATSINADFGLDRLLIRRMMAPLTNITEFTLVKCAVERTSLLEYLKPLKHLKTLSLSEVNLYDEEAIQLDDYKLPDYLKVLKVNQVFYKLIRTTGVSCHKLLTSHNNVQELHFNHSQTELLEPFIRNYPALSKLVISGVWQNSFKDEYYEIVKNNPQLSAITLEGTDIPTQLPNTVADSLKNIKLLIIRLSSHNLVKHFPEFPSFENQPQIEQNRLVLDYAMTDSPQFISKLIGHMPDVQSIKISLNQNHSLVMQSIASQATNLTVLALSAPLEERDVYTNDPSFSDFFRKEFNNRSYQSFQTLRAVYLAGFDPTKFEIEYFKQFKNLEVICLTFDYKMLCGMDQVKEIKEFFEKINNWEVKRYFSICGSVIILKKPNSTLKVPKY